MLNCKSKGTAFDFSGRSTDSSRAFGETNPMGQGSGTALMDRVFAMTMMRGSVCLAEKVCLAQGCVRLRETHFV
jgi:hypothetical protein